MNLEEKYRNQIMVLTPFEMDQSIVSKLLVTFRAITENIIFNGYLTPEQKVIEMEALIEAHRDVMVSYAQEAGRIRREDQKGGVLAGAQPILLETGV